MKHSDPAETTDRRQQFQAGYYDSFAGSFDAACGRENSNHFYKIEQIAESMLAALASVPGPFDILELGSGTGIHAGAFLREHAERIATFTLSDISAGMLEQARVRLAPFAKQTEFVAMPAEHFAVDKCYDGIYVSGSMHHFADPAAALAETKRHLKPGGVVAICEPILWNPVNCLKALRELRAEIGQFRTQRGQVRRLLRSAGFDIVSDRVLHYRSGSLLLRRLVPYQKLERLRCCDPLAVMFLFVARLAEEER